MTVYVCGFMFSPELDRVVLIRKNRGPRKMAGHLNGVGGKIELGEGIRAAMAREFQEETGVITDPTDWTGFHTERYYSDTNNKVHFMCCISPDIDKVKTVESEEVMIIELWKDKTLNIGQSPCMYNLPYLIPMAISWLESPGDRYFEG